jgi:hypothetical protein
MSVFISKYVLRMITIKEHHFHDRDNTLLYSRKPFCFIARRVKSKYIVTCFPTEDADQIGN